MRKNLKSAWLMIALTLTACAPMKGPATATEATLCRLWGESLPTRSHSDTAQTQAEIGAAYADFGAACPKSVNLIPRSGE